MSAKSLYYKDTRVIKCRPITHTNVQENNISLPIVGDIYSYTRIHNAFSSLMMLIEYFNPPSYWFNLSSNNEGNLCK